MDRLTLRVAAFSLQVPNDSSLASSSHQINSIYIFTPNYLWLHLHLSDHLLSKKRKKKKKIIIYYSYGYMRYIRLIQASFPLVSTSSLWKLPQGRGSPGFWGFWDPGFLAILLWILFENTSPLISKMSTSPWALQSDIRRFQAPQPRTRESSRDGHRVMAWLDGLWEISARRLILVWWPRLVLCRDSYRSNCAR